FRVYSNITQVKQIINLLLLTNNFYPAISYRLIQKESDELLLYGLVTRYGPRTSGQLKGNNFYPAISYQPIQKESDELLCTVWSLVMVREPVSQLK
ncbi:unnamed protein product, partial [Heterotrigona itama]